ncbi:hypothetical protein TNCV_1319251 [Trichonephila clavipes]|nr:hypothetical protein TNCV_1319251 [Trichonephila clavipes]
MPHERSRNAYQHVSDLDKGRIVMYRNYSLSYRSIAAIVCQDPMTVSRIWNRWDTDGIRNAVLDLNGPLSLVKTGMLLAWP